jgi:hypothetical protein
MISNPLIAGIPNTRFPLLLCVAARELRHLSPIHSGDDNVTRLPIPLGPDDGIVLAPAVQQEIEGEALDIARQNRQVSDVVRVLLAHAAKHGRTLAIEGSRE